MPKIFKNSSKTGDRFTAISDLRKLGGGGGGEMLDGSAYFVFY